MEDRDKIVKFCEEYLQVKNFKDYCHNGLQVESAEKISKIITGVSFSQKLIKAAVEKNIIIILTRNYHILRVLFYLSDPE